MNETIVGEQATKSLPVWLCAAEEELPEPLRAFYARRPAEVGRTCEQARKSMRDSYVRGILAAHNALAKDGGFKEWCGLIGLNYATAISIVKRASKQPGDGAKPNRSPAPAQHKLPFTFADADDQRHALACINRVSQARGLDREAALLYIIDVFEERVQMMAADAAAITHAGEAA